MTAPMSKRFFTDVRYVAGNILLTKFGIARHHFEFLDMDRGKRIVTHDSLGDEDRILEVVAMPRHEGDEDIAAKSQLAEIR